MLCVPTAAALSRASSMIMRITIRRGVIGPGAACGSSPEPATRSSIPRGLQDEEFISVPVASVVAEIERFRDELLDEEAVLPRHQKKVVTIRPDLSLAGVLKTRGESAKSPSFRSTTGIRFRPCLRRMVLRDGWPVIRAQR